jgi:hypothetical protein
MEILESQDTRITVATAIITKRPKRQINLRTVSIKRKAKRGHGLS